MVPLVKNTRPMVLTENIIPLPKTIAPIINNQIAILLYFLVFKAEKPNRIYPIARIIPDISKPATTAELPLTNAPLECSNSGFI